MRRAVVMSVPRTIVPTASSSSLAESPVPGRANPSPMSVEADRAVSRSSTCLRKSATRKPTAATGTVHRKTVCRLSA